MGYPKFTTGAAGGLAALIIAFTTLGPTAAAQRSAPDRPPEAVERTLSQRVGERILEMMEHEGAGEHAAALAGYRQMLETEGLTPYERAMLLQLAGRSAWELDNSREAIAAWRAALALHALPEEDANTLRINTGQLLLAEGEYRAGIDLMETALARGVPLGADLAMRLAQGYGQLEAYGPGLNYARQAFDLAETPDRPHFSLLLFFYQQLDMLPEQTGLLGQMVARWPDEKAYWTSYASLLARTGREADAFEVNRILYLNGMLTDSDELIRLARYYSYYEYPFGGASMLERELNAGRVEPEPEHFRLLADLWRQAREWERARPVLQRVATLTGAGPDYERLGEALYRAGAFSEAEAMFVQALSRGGLNRPGDTWTLVGNTRVEQDDLLGAIDAFERGLEWDYSRATAQGWIGFIEQKIAIQRDGERFARLTTIEACELEIERMRRGPVISEDQLDSEGVRIFDLSAECEPYFDVNGRLKPEYERA